MYRHLPNLISGARLLAAPVLVWLMVAHQEAAYAWLLAASLASDAVDGWVARRFQLQSRLGALVDSIADVLTLAVAGCGVAAFRPEVFREHAVACIAMIGGWILVCVVALLRYGRLSSFHTYASKIGGYALGLFLCALFLYGYVAWLFWPLVAVSVLGSIEELVLLWYLPAWRSDVRGLWWVMGER